MADEIKQAACYYIYYIAAEEGASKTASVVKALAEAGANLLAFAESPGSPGKSRVDIIIEHAGVAEKTARDMGLSRDEEKSGFYIRGEGWPSATAVLTRLADAQVAVTGVQAISAGGGSFGALIWVKPRDAPKAATLLGPGHDLVDESSEESFPASDPPSWAITHIGFPARI